MPAGPESGAAARSVIDRAESIVARWPGGCGRSLWQRLTVIQDDPADLALGLWFACAGCQVQVCCPDEQPWRPERDDALMPALRQAILEGEPRLISYPLDGIAPDNFRRRWGYTYEQCGDEDLPRLIEGPVEIVVIDGIKRLARNADALLRLIHDRTQWSSSIEIIPRDGDETVEAVIEEVRRRAIAIGFGVRPMAECAESAGEANGLSLVRLSAPMSDHPVPGHAAIMAHCGARLDIAASLARGRRVLDAGGWAGLGARRFLDAGAAHVVNLDVSAEAICLGREQFKGDDRAEFIEWDLNRTPLPFEDGAFDLVICLETLEHITAQREAIAEFDRVLAPGGTLLVSVPDRECETAWERINQHGNAFHLYVPAREELASWLSGFESLRWLRQTDVTGSFVFEEDRAGEVHGGRFDVQEPWSASDSRPQVVMALCAKARAAGGTARRRSARRAAPLTSRLRLYSSRTDEVMDLRSAEAAALVRVRRERFESWCRANLLEAQLRDLTAGLASARNEVEQWRGRANRDEQLASLRQRIDRTHSAIESITAELAAARAQREQEAQRWLKEVNHHTNVINEAMRQRGAAADELRAAHRSLAEQQVLAARHAESVAAAQATIVEMRAENDRLRQRLDAATAQVQAERQHRDRTHAELMAQINRLSARLDDDRRKLLQRIESLLEQSLEQVDRRCLTVEGKVYDLEDDLDRPAVNPHRNGSADA